MPALGARVLQKLKGMQDKWTNSFTAGPKANPIIRCKTANFLNINSSVSELSPLIARNTWPKYCKIATNLYESYQKHYCHYCMSSVYQSQYTLTVFIPIINERLSYHRGTAWCATSLVILSTAAQLYAKLHSKRTALGPWPKVIGIATIWQAIYNLLLVICSNNISMLHHFQNITTFTGYVTACDLDKAISFNKTVEITGYVWSPIH